MEPLSFALVNLDFLYEALEPIPTSEISETDQEITVFTNWGKVGVNRQTGEYIVYDLQDQVLLTPDALLIFDDGRLSGEWP